MRIVIRQPGCGTSSTGYWITTRSMSKYNDYPVHHEEIYDKYYNRVYCFRVDGPDFRPIVRKPRSDFNMDYWSFDVVGLSYERLSFEVYWASSVIRTGLM